MKYTSNNNGQKIGSNKNSLPSLIIKNGHIIDPINKINERSNVIIREGRSK